MDDIVAQAMARWPDVPAVYGWLRLDRRGRWLVKGEPIGHRHTVDFIGRNYHCDALGRHFFQNGPQRVYVDIDHYPHVLWLDGTPDGEASFVTHAGARVEHVRRAWVHAVDGVVVEFDRAGSTQPAWGSVLDRDLPALVDCITDARGRALDASAWECLLEGRAPGCRLSTGGTSVPVEWLAPQLSCSFVRKPRPAPDEEACT